MAQFPLSTIWHIFFRPPSLLMWLQRKIVYLSCLGLIQGRPHHNLSQQALWWSFWPRRKILHALLCAQQPTHPYRLCCAGGKNPACGVPSHQFTSGYRKFWAKVRPSNPQPLVERDKQYSQHACREHLRPLPLEKITIEVSPDGR